MRVNIEIQQPINPNPDIQQQNHQTPHFVTPEPKAKTRLFDVIQKLIKLAIDGSFGKGKGLVHRDLKPSNIFLSNINGKLTAKIGDYGLAKSFDLAGLSGQTFTKMIGGTPGFIPRQQVLKFKDSQPDVDIWASAACLYNMLTGYFLRNFTKDPFMDVLENDPVPILQRNGNIPKKLAQVIDLALIEKPQIYFDSAGKFKEALIKI
ncbi:MAG: protein kinase [Nostocales cyanobacterium ELA583]